MGIIMSIGHNHGVNWCAVGKSTPGTACRVPSGLPRGSPFDPGPRHGMGETICSSGDVTFLPLPPRQQAEASTSLSSPWGQPLRRAISAPSWQRLTPQLLLWLGVKMFSHRRQNACATLDARGTPLGEPIWKQTHLFPGRDSSPAPGWGALLPGWFLFPRGPFLAPRLSLSRRCPVGGSTSQLWEALAQRGHQRRQAQLAVHLDAPGVVAIAAVAWVGLTHSRILVFLLGKKVACVRLDHESARGAAVEEVGGAEVPTGGDVALVPGEGDPDAV